MSIPIPLPLGKPLAAFSGALSGTSGAKAVAVETFDWDDFTAAERVAAELRTDGYTVQVVASPFGGCALVCLPVDYDAVRRARPITRPDRADNRPAAPPSHTPPGPGTGQAVGETAPRPVRPLQPTKEGWEALYALLHVRGAQYERQTEAMWQDERPRRIKALLKREGVSSKRLSADALSVLVDDLTADLEAAGFDVAKADAEYAAKRAAATRQAQTRQAALSSPSTAPRGARSHAGAR